MSTLDLNDFEQCNKLIHSIAKREFLKYTSRVSYTKLDYEDFSQNGWVALQDCKVKGIDDLNYVCVSIRNSMYRGVTNTSIIKTSDKKELWYYISGHEKRMSDTCVEDDTCTLSDIIPSKENIEDKVINSVLVGHIFENLSKDDRLEIIRLMNNLPPKRRKLRELAKLRCADILNGKKVYKSSKAKKQSSIIGVTFDKSKDRWVFSKRIHGKTKTFIRNKDKRIVEEYANEYYRTIAN